MIAKPLKWFQIKLQAKRLRSAGLFDAGWYLSRNPDVRAAGVDPLEHYLKFGATEGRDPHPGFLSSWYLETYADSIESGDNPLIHFHREGRRQGFKPHPALDSIEYWKSLEKSSIPGVKAKPALQSRLVIGFAVTDEGTETTAGDYFSARELGAALYEAFGWEIHFLAKSNSQRCWYDVSGLDCLIVMLEDYDLQRIFGAHENLVTIAWMRNWFDRWVERPWFRSYDIHLCSSMKAANFISSRSEVQTSLLRIATNIKRFNPEIRYESDFASDYCFTGNFWGTFREIEDFDPALLDYSFAIYGAGWEKHERLAKYSRGPVPYSALNQIYTSSKLVIDDANNATKSWGSLNSRVYDALAAGVLVVTNCEVGVQEAFKGMLPTYRNMADLEKQLLYFLSHCNERESLVQSLRTEVVENHTYLKRAQELRTIMLERLA